MDLEWHEGSVGLAALWRRLAPLRRVTTFLMTGAHPDDEWSGFLARLALGEGVNVVYACATRGDGGQNAVGPERGRALAALRTGEMARAAAVLGVELRWLDFPDFGFSKSAEDTLGRWGEAALVGRLRHVIDEVRPDLICPTFLDVPGQHGHHRAVTRATLAAAAGFQAKLFLPADSGGGGTYDDAEPPPPATHVVEIGGFDPMLGATYAQVGEWSRRQHRTQGMGRWKPAAPEQVRLHQVSGPGGGLFDGLPRTLADLGQPEAQRWIDEAIERFPRVEDPLEQAFAALTGMDPRVETKRRQIAAALRTARGEVEAAPMVTVPAETPVPLPAVVVPTGLRVGYVETVDRGAEHLTELGLSVDRLSDRLLADGDLGRWDAILVGMFGFGHRPVLRQNLDRLLDWVKAGGRLVTQYHRPGDGWEAERLGITIGSPSLRWRVTDPAAPVRVLEPGHPLLEGVDWSGWVRERGLYFAKAWQAPYRPLLAIADAGEPELEGSLLVGRFGAGAHVHCALALHHQLEAGIAGGAQLLVNLLARRAG